MKNLYRIGIFLIVCIVTGILAVYLFDKFVVGVKDIGRLPQIYESSEQLEYYRSTGQPAPTATPSPEAALTAAEEENVVSKTTRYLIEEYDRNTHEENVIAERVPPQYIGMDREALEEALSLYLQAPSLEDLERGLQAISITGFSPQQITIRKSYYLEPEPDEYYLTVEEGYVVVYYRNMGNLFCETGIELTSLPKRLQLEISHIKTIRTEEELYAFLESYSS